MIANFKWKQNTNGFARNSQNINKKWRPQNYFAFLLKDAIETGELTKGLSIALQYALSKKKVSLKELCMIQNIAFARWYYLTGGDMKKYYKVFKIK